MRKGFANSCIDLIGCCFIASVHRALPYCCSAGAQPDTGARSMHVNRQYLSILSVQQRQKLPITRTNSENDTDPQRESAVAGSILRILTRHYVSRTYIEKLYISVTACCAVVQET